MSGQVVNLRARHADNEAVELSRSAYARLQRGELHSVFYIASGPNVDGEVGIAGKFADDLDYARRAALAGFKALFGDEFEISTTTRRPLPRDLKKGYR